MWKIFLVVFDALTKLWVTLIKDEMQTGIPSCQTGILVKRESER